LEVASSPTFAVFLFRRHHLDKNNKAVVPVNRFFTVWYRPTHSESPEIQKEKEKKNRKKILAPRQYCSYWNSNLQLGRELFRIRLPPPSVAFPTKEQQREHDIDKTQPKQLQPTTSTDKYVQHNDTNNNETITTRRQRRPTATEPRRRRQNDPVT
jgi:hypothetical protein